MPYSVLNFLLKLGHCWAAAPVRIRSLVFPLAPLLVLNGERYFEAKVELLDVLVGRAHEFDEELVEPLSRQFLS